MVTTAVQIGTVRLAAEERSLQKRSNLTGSQFLMWLGQQIDQDLPLYNMIQTFRIDASIDPLRFDRAWCSLVAAADALRTTIVEVDGVPMRRVTEAKPNPIEVVDLRSEPDPESASAAWIEKRKLRRLDLSAQLWDTALLLVGDDVSIWYLCKHHLITDGQAFAVVYNAMSERYGLECAGRLDEATPLTSYEDYVEYEVGARTSSGWKRSMAYWNEVSSAPVEPLSFYGGAVGGRTARTERLVLEVDETRSARLRQIAESEAFHALTPELSRHAVWATVLVATLHRTTSAAAMRIGTPFLGRPTASFRDTIGLFIEIGALHADVEDHDTFSSLGQRVLAGVVKGMLNARPGISSASTNRSYEVLLNSVTSRFEPFAGHEVTTDWIHTGYGDPDHALRLQVTDFDTTGSFRLFFDVNVERLGETEQQWLLQQFDVTLQSLLDDPEQSIGGFDLLDEDQRTAMTVTFNESTATYPERCVSELFADQVMTTPDAVAVEDAQGSITFAELATMSTTISATLSARRVSRGDNVAICTARSRYLVAAMLGVLQAGAVFVPIDPRLPAARRRAILDDAEARALLVADGVSMEDFARADASSGSGGSAPVVIDISTTTASSDTPGSSETAASSDTTAAMDPPTVDERAYMIYTSGSTGAPKAAMLTHRCLVNYIWWARSVYQDDHPADFALYSSISFDLTITSIFVPLVSGGRIVAYDNHGDGSGLEILDVFDDDRVDVVKLTPSHLTMVRNHGIDAKRIKRLIVGGENFRTDLAREVGDLFENGVRIFNEYGPTEATVGCMLHEFDPRSDTGTSVPIGRPAANASIHVVDRYDQPVPPGVVGEMIISGDGVAEGYWNRQDLTADRFATDLFGLDARSYRTGDLARWTSAGELELLGRNDGQVKVGGARIELGEIEAALAAHPAVSDVVVDVVSSGGLTGAPIEHCANCGLPSNHPDAGFDDERVCRDCRAFAVHRNDVDRYWRTPADLQGVVDGAKARTSDPAHDCIVLVSGGKDSTYMLYQLVRDYGVRPLVFTLDNGYLSESALDNVRSACEDLDIDLQVATTPHMNAIFADSLERHANVCDGCFKTVYTLSMALARQLGISTIITGLARGQLFETRLADSFAAGEFEPERIDQWILDARKAYHHIDDAVTRNLGGDLFADDSIFSEVGFVDFYRYVDVGLDEVYSYLENRTVWSRPADTGRSTNCLINDVGIYAHQRLRGYHNYALPYSWDVRLGHKNRAAAMDELDDEIDTARVREILDEIGFDRSLIDEVGTKRLAAYYVPRSPDESEDAIDPLAAGVGPGELSRYLADLLPDFMVPNHLIPLTELPLTVNGKVDKAALPEPGNDRGQLETEFVGPRSGVEQTLTDMWGAVLRVPVVGVHDNFFELGGDSIASIQIVTMAADAGLKVSARDIFTSQTVAELAVAIDSTDSTGGTDRTGSEPFAGETAVAADDLISAKDRRRIEAQLSDRGGLATVEDLYPLTPTQLGMLYHSLGSDGHRMYVGQASCFFPTVIEEQRFRDAWAVVVGRHPACRARMLWIGLDMPVQVIEREVRFPWKVYDWTGRSATDTNADLDELLERDRRIGMSLDRDPLMNFALVSVDDGTHFVWNSHHALLDGWSAHLLLREVLEAYPDPDLGAGPSATRNDRFGDHVEALLTRDSGPATVWWTEQLGGVSSATPLPLRPKARGGLPRHRSESRRIERSLSSDLGAFLRSNRLTLNSLANGAWAVVLGNYSSSDDVLFGTTVSGRDTTVVNAEQCVGMFITTLPTRVRLNTSESPAVWLQGIQSDGLQARQFGHLSLPELQRLTDIDSAQPMFDSIVVVENFPSSVPENSADLTTSALRFDAPSNLPLSLLVHPGDEIVLEAVFDADRLDSASAQRLLGHLEQAMAELTRAESVGHGQIITESEASQLQTWEQGEPVEVADTGLPIHERILARAAEQPSALAVTAGDGSLSYGELASKASALGRMLVERGPVTDRHIGVTIGDDTAVFVAILAVLMAGGVYVPLDRELPTSRLQHIANETKMAVVLVADTEEPITELDLTEQLLVTTLELEAGQVTDTLATAPMVARSASDPAYVIYTSGSTGTPRGVQIDHGNIAYSTAVRDQVYGDGPDRFLVVSSLAFDSSLVGLFWTLCSGGTVIAATTPEGRSIARLRRLIAEHRVSHLLALPSFYGLLLDEATPPELASLNTIIVAGEPCPTGLVRRHDERCSHARLFNEYGPTETTVWSHAAQLDGRSDLDKPPIGRPIPGGLTAVLDHRARRCPVGVSGELFIGGPGVGNGYLAAPELTHAVLGPDPKTKGSGPSDGESVAVGLDRWYRTGDLVRWRSDGQLEFVARSDAQIKLRGHRIELGEVEAALGDLPEISEAVASIDEYGRGSDPRRLIAHYTGPEPLPTDELRQLLSTRLPRSMMPAAFMHLDEFPRTPTGKVDRRSLPTPDDGTRLLEPLGDELERRLGDVWRQILGVEDLGRSGDFFELGGDSLDAMRMLARIEQLTGRALPLEALFQAPTIAAIADLIRSATEISSTGPLVGIAAQGFKRPFFYVTPYEISIVEIARLARHFDPNRPLYGLQPSGLSEGEEIDTSIEDMAQRYVNEIRAVQPRGPYLIGGHCDGGWIAFEMAVQLRDQGEQVAYLGLVDMPPPGEYLSDKPALKHVGERVRYYLADGRLRHAVQWQAKLWFERTISFRFGSPAKRRIRSVREVHSSAFANHRFRHDTRTPLDLIRSSELAVQMDEISWYDDLRADNPSVSETNIASTHARLLLDPETRELAVALCEGLDRSEREYEN